MAYRIRDWDVSLDLSNYLFVLSNDVYVQCAYSRVTVPRSPPLPPVTTCQSVYPKDVPWLIFVTRTIQALRISVNNTFAAPQHGQENHFFLVFALWCLAPRSIVVMEAYILATVFREKTSILTNVVYKP